MQRRTSRRQLLSLCGAGAFVVLAGCSGDGDPQDNGTTGEDGTDDDNQDPFSGDDHADDAGDGMTDDEADDPGAETDDNGDDGDETDGGESVEDETDDTESEPTGETRLRDVFNWASSFTMDIETPDGSGTWTYYEGDWTMTGTFEGQTMESYNVDGVTYTVFDGQCFKMDSVDPEDDFFDPEQPDEDDEEYVSTGRATVAGEEVYVFDVDDGQYYISVNTGYPVRFEGDDGIVVDFHSWGSTEPISPPDMDCAER